MVEGGACGLGGGSSWVPVSPTSAATPDPLCSLENPQVVEGDGVTHPHYRLRKP